MKLDSYLTAIMMLVLANVAAIVGLLLFRRLLQRHDLNASHEVGGYLLSVVGTLYAVTLGLIVVDSMSKFQEAHATTLHESNAISDLVLLSKRLPPDHRARVEALATAYVDSVVAEEWPVLDEGRHSARTRQVAFELLDTVRAFTPTSDREHSIYELQLQISCDFWNERQTRLNTAAQGIPALEWFVMLLGGAITVCFTYLFKLDYLRIQLVMTTMVATVITLNLVLVLMFGYPYSGQLKVDPGCFQVVRDSVASKAASSPTFEGSAGDPASRSERGASPSNR